jgi:fused signal recognition particle receptor
MTMITKWKTALLKSNQNSFSWWKGLLNKSDINALTWLEIEDRLIKADVGISTTTEIIEDMQRICQIKGITKSSDLQLVLKEELRKRIQTPRMIEFSSKPFVVMLVGVNGSGKTTTLAKLGYLFSNKKKILLVGADTFRAAAFDQLSIWSKRLDVPIISGQTGSDPGAIVYDALQHALSRNFDLILIDTAGRLHTRFNLMDELKKICRVAGKTIPGAPHETWLVLDATTGQNAITQARAFNSSINITGIILAKLDSSSKGGMVFAIQDELNVPILFAGLGEGLNDFAAFNPDEFVSGILGI